MGSQYREPSTLRWLSAIAGVGMNWPAGFKDWRTTIVGLAQFANGVVPAWQLYHTAMSGILDPRDIQRLAVYGATFVFINGVLQAIKGAITPSSAKVKEKTEELVEQKLAEKGQ